ncbi:MAG: molybdopterin converting factor subunit 1 [Chloroflexi bacterium]|nr:molybdopterin converting factor subunit 1 [Chloroflexota bacterium]
MKVKAKFFAAMREALDRTEMEIELPSGATVQQLVNLIAEQYPVLRSYLDSTLVAVNRKYALPQTELHDGDEVAFVPPVGGG